MIAIFFVLSSSITVTFNSTKYPYIKKQSDFTFHEYQSTHDFLTALILPEGENVTSSYLKEFADVSLHSLPYSDYIYFEAAEANTLLQAIQIPPPAVVCFFQSHLIGFFKYPDDPSELGIQLTSLLSSDHPTIFHKEELEHAVGLVSYTILVRPEKSQDAAFLMTHSISIGTTSLLMCDKQLFKEIGLPNADMALFRRVDRMIVPINLNMTEFKEAHIPSFQNFSHFSLLDPEKVYAGFATDTYFQSNDEILFNLSQNHPTFIFGHLLKNVNVALPHVIRDYDPVIPSFYVFSLTNGYYYPHPSNLRLDGEISSTYENVEKYLTMIEEGKIKPRYFSDPEPVNSDVAFKLVGTTYQNFFKTDKDVIIMYYHDSANESHIEEFKKAAEYLFEHHIKNVSFGYINFANNSSPLRYPPFYSIPQTVFFPANNRSDTRLMFGYPLWQEFTRFTIENLSEKKSFPKIPLTNAEAEKHLFSALSMARQLPNHLKLKAKEYVKKLTPYTGFDPDQEERGINQEEIQKILSSLS